MKPETEEAPSIWIENVTQLPRLVEPVSTQCVGYRLKCRAVDPLFYSVSTAWWCYADERLQLALMMRRINDERLNGGVEVTLVTHTLSAHLCEGYTCKKLSYGALWHRLVCIHLVHGTGSDSRGPADVQQPVPCSGKRTQRIPPQHWRRGILVELTSCVQARGTPDAGASSDWIIALARANREQVRGHSRDEAELLCIIACYCRLREQRGAISSPSHQRMCRHIDASARALGGIETTAG